MSVPSAIGPGAVESQRPALIGRTEELAFCEALLAGTERTGIVITGAAGVGKTRLATEVLRSAEGAGYASMRVTATEAGRAIPLGPFAHLLPARADPPSMEATPALELLRLARAALVEDAASHPLVLLVDDAHLLDPASALLVQQLAAAAEATVLATVRSGEPVADAIVALWKDHGCDYLELQPLSVEEAGMLTESIVGGEIDGETKHRLWEASRGLPLILRELVLGGLEHGVLAERSGLWRWRGPLQAGGRLLELAGARIGQLDADERALLETVAAGEPMSAAMLDARQGNAADRLISRSLLVADRDGRRLHLRLAHPLFGEYVRARMPETRRSQVQRRLADRFEAAGLRRRDDLLRFAFWRVESGGTASPDLLLRAAQVAGGLNDHRLAERLARAAADAGGGIQAQRMLAGALIVQGRLDEAEAILLPLMEEARTEEERMRVAATRARNLMGFGRIADVEAVLVRAEGLITDEELRRELRFMRGTVVATAGRWAEAGSTMTELIAEASVSPLVCVPAASWAAGALAQTGRSEDAREVIARWEPSAEQDVDLTRPRVPPIFVRANFWEARVLALLYAGQLTEAEAAAEQAYSIFVAGPASYATASLAVQRGLVALVQGRPQAAVRWFREAAALVEFDRIFTSWALALLAQGRGQAGDTIGAKRALTQIPELPDASLVDPDLLLARAWTAAAEGAFEEAQQAALAAADLAEERGALAPAFLAAHDAVRLGDPVEGLSRLTRIAGRVQGSLAPACAEHAEAILSRDARRIERAASSFAELGALLWAAEAESAAAHAHREAGRAASARAAAARATVLVERCGGARTPALGLAGPVEELTAREREIATLAVRGASNREIAARLVVSVRTVENHLQHVYRKLGVRGRRELAGLLKLPE